MSAAGPGLRPEQWMRSPDGSWIVRSPTSTRRTSQVSTARTSRFRTLEIRGRRIGFMARPGPADHGHSSSYPSSYAAAHLMDCEFLGAVRTRTLTAGKLGQLGCLPNLAQQAIDFIDHFTDVFIAPKQDAVVKMGDRFPRSVFQILELKNHKPHFTIFGRVRQSDMGVIDRKHKTPTFGRKPRISSEVEKWNVFFPVDLEDIGAPKLTPTGWAKGNRLKIKGCPRYLVLINVIPESYRYALVPLNLAWAIVASKTNNSFDLLSSHCGTRHERKRNVQNWSKVIAYAPVTIVSIAAGRLLDNAFLLVGRRCRSAG